MKKYTFTGIVVAVLVVGGVFPSLASAQSSSTSSPPISIPRVCGLLARSLSVGAQGDDVRALQEFLRDRGMLPTDPTGYFGAVTSEAVRRWQTEQGVTPAGIFGPVSRERLVRLCGGVVPPVPPTATSSRPTPLPQATLTHRVCSLLARSLSVGAQGDDVRALQEFLRDRGMLPTDPTGYFGMVTSEAVRRWQTEQGVTPAGIFGPVSRERLVRLCGGVVPPPAVLNAIPMSGAAPLVVSFRANVSIMNPQMVADAGSYKVTFGDGAEQVLSCTGAAPQCAGPHVISHTYTANGAYTASLVHYGYFAPPGDSGSRVVGSAQIRVGPQICTMDYNPVCGSKQVQCITTPCNPVQQTYSNRCGMEADGATFLYAGECRPTTNDPSSDPRCKAWYDGCNTCSRASASSSAMCTLRACLNDTGVRAYCTAYFSENEGNLPPTISSFSGPTALAVNSSGTWSINASDPENGTLTYSIQWGDEWYARSSLLEGIYPGSAVVQTTTFTHSYASAGTYTVRIVVRDSAGKTATTSATVQVGALPTPVN